MRGGGHRRASGRRCLPRERRCGASARWPQGAAAWSGLVSRAQRSASVRRARAPRDRHERPSRRSRICAPRYVLHRVRDTAKRINKIILATRSRPSLLRPPRYKDSSLQQEGGEAPKGACQPFAAPHQQTLPPADTSGAAARHIGARPPSGASTAALAGTPIPAQLQAMLPGTWNQAGVTRSIPSQCSDSTSRLGRSTEGNDARSRSGADCEPARKHRTRSTLQIASGMRPSMSEIFPM